MAGERSVRGVASAPRGLDEWVARDSPVLPRLGPQRRAEARYRCAGSVELVDKTVGAGFAVRGWRLHGDPPAGDVVP